MSRPTSTRPPAPDMAESPTDVQSSGPPTPDPYPAEQRGRPGIRRSAGSAGRRWLAAIGWFALSTAVFAGLWELAWAMGWADPLLLPPPHIFLRNFADQGKFFDSANIGSQAAPPLIAVATTVLATMLRVLAGLALGFVASLIVGIAATQIRLLGRLSLPTITLLAPISAVAWLPVAIFVFGIGDAPAVFLVFIGIFFIMTLATVAQIESVSQTWLDVGRTMGANRRQLLLRVVLPAILPGLFVVLRLNLFAAWAVVLIAEAVGVGSGLGQVVLLARNTFNSSLVFFTMTIIGISGYLLDLGLRTVQKRLLWWQPAAGVGTAA
jgi:NitT/TauT family transport system permease protein